jgi:hypothetical protein
MRVRASRIRVRGRRIEMGEDVELKICGRLQWIAVATNPLKGMDD